MPHDLEGFRKVLERKASPRCPSCGGNAWAFWDGTVLLQKVDPEGPTPKGRGLPTFPVVCGDCGYVRLHSVGILEKQLHPEVHGNGSR